VCSVAHVEPSIFLWSSNTCTGHVTVDADLAPCWTEWWERKQQQGLMLSYLVGQSLPFLSRG
jgi:hypothetical protein